MLVSQLIKNWKSLNFSQTGRKARRKSQQTGHVAAEVLEVRQVPCSLDLRLPMIQSSASPVAVSATLQNGESITCGGSVGVSNRPVLLTLQSEGGSFSHQIGRRDRDGWSVNVKDTPNRFMSYGPYTTSVPAGNRTATFRLQLDNVTADNNRILTIDVFDASTGKVLAKDDLYRKDFSSALVYKNFNLDFKAEPGHRLEFRTYWHGGSYVKQDDVTIR